jgi:enolase
VTAVEHVNDEIAAELRGCEADDQAGIDGALAALDGSAGFGRLGANAILGVSLATVRAAAADDGQPLWRHLANGEPRVLPMPMMNVINGGRHADIPLAIQETMIVPVGASSFAEALWMGAATYHALGQVIRRRAPGGGVGDEGGYAPNIAGADEAIDLVLEAIARAGYEPGTDIAIALDAAATELHDEETYRIEDESDPLSTDEVIGYWAALCAQYPIVAIEDGLAEEDWIGWQHLTRRLGDTVQLIGDDVFVSHESRLALAVEQQIANAILVKPNQVGTLTLTLETIRAAHTAGYATVMSHRSGETEDTLIADLAVAAGCRQIKAGAPARGERVAKYNQLLRIEEALGADAQLASFPPTASRVRP